MEEKMDEKLGIPMSAKLYIKNKDVSRPIEYEVITAMTHSVAEWFADTHGMLGQKADIKFINYGDTELVYVMDYDGKKYTLLFGQPIVPHGQIKQETELLKKYAEIDSKTVVAPLKYYPISQCYLDEMTDKFYEFKKEAFITPYFHQARCIASQMDGFGVYVPEPEYHFEKFSKEDSGTVCACMIAKLITLYDEKTKTGIAACKLGGGDFMLEKSWNSKNITATDTLNHMKLIAAREEINCTLNEYIKLIRKEFVQRTYYTSPSMRDKSILINHKARIGMTPSAVETGIALGLRLRKARKEKVSAKHSTNSKTQNKNGANKGTVK